MTSVEVSAAAGIVLSLLFSYAPGLNAWYDQLTPTPKRLVMLGILLVTAAGALAYQCRGDGPCYGLNVETYLRAFVSAAIANQTTYLFTPLSPERRALRKAVSKKNEPSPFLPGDHEPYTTNKPQAP